MVNEILNFRKKTETSKDSYLQELSRQNEQTDYAKMSWLMLYIARVRN